MEYTPDVLAGQFATGAHDVMVWVGAGVGGALVLFFLFLGIRAGFRIFWIIGQERSAWREEMDGARQSQWDAEDAAEPDWDAVTAAHRGAK